MQDSLTMVHQLVDTTVDETPALTLSSSAGIAATFVPAGMVGASLTHHGEELLGQRKGLAGYLASHSTFGIPLLHPWANRLRRRGYKVAGREVSFDEHPSLVRPDENGLPIHGLCAGMPWEIVDRGADDHAASVHMLLDLTSREDFLEAFPFPHEVRVGVELTGSVLTVTTTLNAVGGTSEPVAFGWHPYFKLPGVPRNEWDVTIPLKRRAVLDGRSLPTGEVVDADISSGQLGSRTFDDLFVDVDAGTELRVAGGGRAISVHYVDGYRYAVVYAPKDDDVICFEPMTAPTAPFSGDRPPRMVPPGGNFTATFAVSVEETG